AVNNLIETFHRFNVFKAPETDSDKRGYLTEKSGGRLMLLASNNVAINEIEVDLLSAEERGLEKMLTNVRESIVEETVHFFAPVKKNCSKTFASLCKCSTINSNNEKKMIKTDR
ncbi:hypothetical protein SK128_023277, partial [Halocaridina rubra]